MAGRNTTVDRAVRVAAEDQRRVLADIGRAQLSAGLSDEVVARACHTSRWTVARIVQGRQPAPVIELAAIGAAVGLDIRVHAYPAGDAIRDAGQQRLIARFREQLNPSIRMTTEVPLAISGDLRAWDAMLRGTSWHKPVEAETVVDDVQALERRLRLKLGEGGESGMVLVIADTKRNRAAIAAVPLAFEGFDRNARRVLAALRAGRDPDGSSILFV